jgi:microcystin-dependent protein
MSQPFVAEIRAFGFNFSPRGWAYCNGQLLPISQFSAVFALIGTTFGGNGTSTFGLPNLMGRAAMHWGNGAGLGSYVWGEVSGTETVALRQSEMPQHNHAIQAAEGGGGGGTGTPDSTTWLGPSRETYAPGTTTPNTQLSPKAISGTGGNQPHNNMQPYQVVNFCISLSGVFPSRN